MELNEEEKSHTPGKRGQSRGIEYLQNQSSFYKILYGEIYQCIFLKDDAEIIFSSGELTDLTGVDTFEYCPPSEWHKTFKDYINRELAD